MKGQVIAIGGGAMSKETEDYPIEKYILEQTNKTHPKICFLATATGDADRNIVRFYEVFSRFNCKCSHLSLFNPPKDLQSFVLKQDAFYVGGGNTRNLLALWREWGLDLLLKQALIEGAVLSGFSAGSICWFEEGLSDYIPGTLQPLKALGFIAGSHCPHYNNEPHRRSTYQRLIAERKLLPGIAADDDVALHYKNGKLFQAVSSNVQSCAYQVSLDSNVFLETRITPTFIA